MGGVVEESVVIQRGEVWWVDLAGPDGPGPPGAKPRGSGPGYRRPVLVLQSDAFNRSRIGTVVVAAITSRLELAAAPGNVKLGRRESGLPRPAVVNVSQILTLDRRFLTGRAGRVPPHLLTEVEKGVRLVAAL